MDSGEAERGSIPVSTACRETYEAHGVRHPPVRSLSIVAVRPFEITVVGVYQYVVGMNQPTACPRAIWFGVRPPINSMASRRFPAWRKAVRGSIAMAAPRSPSGIKSLGCYRGTRPFAVGASRHAEFVVSSGRRGSR